MVAASPILDVTRAQQLIRLLTDGLTNISDDCGEFVLELRGGKLDTKGWKNWEWTHGVALSALIHHAQLSPGSPRAKYSLKTAMDWFNLQYKLTEGKGAPKNINTMAPLYSLSAMLLDDSIDRDSKWLAWCDDWAEWIINDLPKTRESGFQHMNFRSDHDNNLWDDTLMMTVIPLAHIGLLLDRPQYVEEAKYQFLLHIKYLVDQPSGLWYHGWEYTPGKDVVGHNFAKALWARGNCWATLSIPLFIELLGDRLPASDLVRKYLVITLKSQIDALLKVQDQKTGLWHTVLNEPTSYVETSAAAGFAAGILMALRLGLISGDEYRQSAEKAVRGVVANNLPDGQVDSVSFGTGVSYELDFYRNIPITSMPYGQALAMWALVEWIRAQE